MLDTNTSIEKTSINSKNMNSDDCNINENIKSHGSDSPPKICLREKKRERERNGTMAPSLSSAASSIYSSVISIGAPLDKDRWRHSSTTILDSLYKDLSKDIPTIDDVYYFFNLFYKLLQAIF